MLVIKLLALANISIDMEFQKQKISIKFTIKGF